MAKVQNGVSPETNMEQELNESQESINELFEEMPGCIRDLRIEFNSLQAQWDTFKAFLETTFTGEPSTSLGSFRYTFADGPVGTGAWVSAAGGSMEWQNSNTTRPQHSFACRGNIWHEVRYLSDKMMRETATLIGNFASDDAIATAMEGDEDQKNEMLNEIIEITHGGNADYLYWNNGQDSDILESGKGNYAGHYGADEAKVKNSLARWFLPYPLSDSLKSDLSFDGQAYFASDIEMSHRNSTEFSTLEGSYSETWHPSYWAEGGGTRLASFSVEGAATDQLSDLMMEANKRYNVFKDTNASAGSGTSRNEDSWERFSQWTYDDLKNHWENPGNGLSFTATSFGGRILSHPLGAAGGQYITSNGIGNAGNSGILRNSITVQVGGFGSINGGTKGELSSHDIKRNTIRWWHPTLVDELFGAHWLLRREADSDDPDSNTAWTSYSSNGGSWYSGRAADERVGKGSLATSADGCMGGGYTTGGMRGSRPTIMCIFALGSLRAPDTFQWWLSATGRSKNPALFYSQRKIGSYTGLEESGYTMTVTKATMLARSNLNVNFARDSCRASDGDNKCTLMTIPSYDMGYWNRSFFDSEAELATSALDSGKMFGSNAPGAGSESALSQLLEAYNAWKSAVWQFREKLECAVQKSIEAYIKVQDLRELAKAVRDGVPTSPADKEMAERILEETEDAALGNLAGFDSSFTKRLVFKEQCFLLAKIFDLAEFKTGVDINEDENSTAAAVGTNPDGGAYEAFAGGLDYIPGYKLAPYVNDIAEEMDISPYGTSGPKNACLMVDGDPYGFINRLTQSPVQESLMSAKVHEISSLQPLIRLYIVKYNEAAQQEQEVPITFSSHIDFDNEGQFVADATVRGHNAVGISSFEFSYDGSNPFAAKKSIKAKLVLFAQNMTNLLEDRHSQGFSRNEEGSLEIVDHVWKYVDLALKTAPTTRGGFSGENTLERCSQVDDSILREQNENLTRLNFRLKAVVGWADPTSINSDILSDEVKDAIYDSYVTLNLTPTVHNFEFDDQGRVKFNINYLAYTDDFFDQKPYNVFTNIDIHKAQIAREFTYNVYRRNCMSDAIEDLKESDADIIQEEKTRAVSTLINSLLLRDKIFYINMSMDEIRTFMSQGPFYEMNSGNAILPLTSEDRDADLSSDMSNLIENYLDRNSAESELEIRAALNTARPDRGDVPFFYLSDLVDVVLENVGSLLPEMIDWLSSEGLANRHPEFGVSSNRAMLETYASNRAAYLSRTTEGRAEYMEEVTSMAAADREAAEQELHLCRARAQDPDRIASTGESSEDALAQCSATFSQAISLITQRSEYRLGDVYTDDDFIVGTTYLHNILQTSAADIAEQSAQEARARLTARSAAARRGGGLLGQADPCDIVLKKAEYERLNDEFKKFRVILGPMELVDYKNDIRTKNINLGDIPISVKYFIEWLTEKLSAKEEVRYPLGSFLNDLLNNLARNFLNDDTCFQTNIRQRTRISQAAITAYKDGDPNSNPRGLDQITRAIVRYFPDKRNPGRIPLSTFLNYDGPLNISGLRGVPGGNGGFENEINYLTFVAGRTQPREKMTGDPEIDHPAGIFHYTLGRSDGIIKNIKLSKTQTPGLTEVRFEQEGYDGLAQLRVVYDVDITSYANVKVFPGTYLFVNPQSFAPGTSLEPDDEFNLTRYGIGGYYMVIRSTHKFAAGKAETQIHAKWVNQVDALAEQEDLEGSSDGGDGGSSPRCR